MCNNFFSKITKNNISKKIIRECRAGIYSWAACSVLQIEGKTVKYKKFISRVKDLDESKAAIYHIGKLNFFSRLRILAGRIKHKIILNFMVNIY